ncbi:DUF7689 domain-containing protein [Paludisphaera borealis]|uniref:DUF7689 domain-containing protein n=1 Tax=Paludisphaera borealis TaxID=1387353 RepID=UPI00403B1AD2
MEADRNFPRLSPGNHRLTSPAAVEYNCIAWAADDVDHRWQPGVYWPAETSTEDFGLGPGSRVQDTGLRTLRRGVS